MTNPKILSTTVRNTVGPCTNGLFTLYSAKDFPDLPELSWIIDNIFPSTGLACVYGRSGIGKSFICLDMAAAIARGMPWFGYPTTQSNVVYIVLEGQAGFRRRVAAWEKRNCVSFPENVKFVFDRFSITDSNHPKKLGDLINQCGGATTTFIDTLNRAAPGSDENSSSDMSEILAGATKLQQLLDGLVVLLHHPGKDLTRGLRGHSSLQAGLDAVIEIEKDGELLHWNLIKSKDGEDGIGRSFKLEVVEIGEAKSGKMITSCVVQEAEGMQRPKKQAEPNGANQIAILAAVRDVLMEQRIQSVVETTDRPEGMLFEDVVSAVKDTLQNVGPKHRLLRTKEALEALVRQGFLVWRGDLLGLPYKKSIEEGGQ